MFLITKKSFSLGVHLFLFFTLSGLVRAQTVPLNDGRVAEGKTIEKPDSAMVIGHIHRLLKHLGYPENTWPAIDNEVIALLVKIDFAHLKEQAIQIKSDPLKLKEFVTKLGALLEQEGYIERQTPHPLVKLLTTSFVNDDISQVIFSSRTSFLQKVDSKKALAACTAISQLGSIILDLLDIQVKVVFSPAHVFNGILLNDQQVLFVDFSNQIFEIVDVDRYYYHLVSRTRKLKDQYRISPARMLEINGQLTSELKSDPLQELLCFLYGYIYISDDYATTPAIFLNLGNIYSQKGNYEQAILDDDKAIEMDPDFAEAYRERGIIYGNKGDLDRAISDLGKAIELFPDFADAFHDRANIYSSKGDMDNAIFDLNQAIIINPDFVEAYHDRAGVYSSKGDTDNAIADDNKAIEIDPYFSQAYQSRAEAYFSKQEYDKSWEDIHKVEDFGDEVNPDFIEKLKKASEYRKFFLPILIIAPILLVLVLRFI
jgi:tetratricopeptide (TPR) repeat protein